MVTEISIKNYKSIVDLNIPLGKVNVLIGENGGGKTNILEAISYGVAASLDKLDNEFLGLRGIRVTEPRFMLPAFKEIYDTIRIKFFTNEKIEYDALYDKNVVDISDILCSINPSDPAPIIFTADLSLIIKVKSPFNRFISYCPEESSLRTFRDEYQLLPLGRKGEGLFKYLKDLSKTQEGRSVIQEINENLSLLDWFEGVVIPTDTFSNDYSLQIKDKYITKSFSYFDQRSTNEGFLYLLFYLTLFISKDTPVFFAIDNIESSFNPKLCTKVMQLLTKLAKEHDKQVIITTHNPFILDGLNLSDDNERLFVVRRNDEGHTKLRRIEYKPERKKKLSELWMSGAIGGLPDNF
jgi:predicted ATPase